MRERLDAASAAAGRPEGCALSLGPAGRRARLGALDCRLSAQDVLELAMIER